MRTQVALFDEFLRDVSWITQDILERYILARIKSDASGDMVIAKYAQGDALKMRTFRETVLENYEFLELAAEIWAELGMPEEGSPQYEIWQLERLASNPKTSPDEAIKARKLKAEINGWLTKPGEKSINVNVQNVSGSNIEELMQKTNKLDAARTYQSLVAASR